MRSSVVKRCWQPLHDNRSCQHMPTAPACAAMRPHRQRHKHGNDDSIAVSTLLAGIAAGSMVVQAPAAQAIDAGSSFQPLVPIVSAVTAVLSEQQQALAQAQVPAPPLRTATAATPAEGRRRVYFDMLVDGEPSGRIVVELYDDVPVGAARFADLAQGKQGVGYRRTKFDAINENFVRHAGLRRLSFGSEQETALTGGDGVEQLEVELESGAHQHTDSGEVSLVVRTDKPLPVKTKLTAYRGKLVEVTEQLGEKPNGTAFAITLRAMPSLDQTNLVVGKVVEGMNVVQALAALPSVKDNSTSGYVKTAKFIGDRRADVAIRSFGRPYNKIVIAESGPLT